MKTVKFFVFLIISTYIFGCSNNKLADIDYLNQILDTMEYQMHEGKITFPHYDDEMFKQLTTDALFNYKIPENGSTEDFDALREIIIPVGSYIGRLDSLYSLLDDSYQKEKIETKKLVLRFYEDLYRINLLGYKIDPDCPIVNATTALLDIEFANYYDTIRVYQVKYKTDELEKVYKETEKNIEKIREKIIKIKPDNQFLNINRSCG